MKMIVGLGNPGPKYQLTRHNIGFMVVDALARSWGGGLFKSEHKSLTHHNNIQTEKVLLVKPQTYMNLSGEAVQSLMSYYSLELSGLLVIQDDVDLPFATLKFQKGRGHGGHNGIRNIHQHIDKDYARLKLGVSRPSHPGFDVADYLLSNFNNDELKGLEDFLPLACEAVESFILDGYDKAINRYNNRKGDSA